MAEIRPAPYPKNFESSLDVISEQLTRIAEALEKLASCVKDGEIQMRQFRPPDEI